MDPHRARSVACVLALLVMLSAPGGAAPVVGRVGGPVLGPGVGPGAGLSDTLTTVTFERERPGRLPSAFRTFTSEEKQQGRWQVTRFDGKLVLSQTDINPAGYRLAVLDEPRIADVRVGARLRMGRGDRAAGLAWRVRDGRNYYAARLDFQEREFVVHKFVGGNRIRLARVQDVRLGDGAWHEILVEQIGSTIKVWLNGIPVASEKDDGLRGQGRLGFWMPGDSTAHFERLWYEPLPQT